MKKKFSNFAPQADFPLLETFKSRFPVTKDTIFAYDGCIYTNNELPDHLIVHEMTHLKQQEREGLERWTIGYLDIPEYRLMQEVEAYQAELRSIPNREMRFRVHVDSAKKLSSPLYGEILSFEEAMEKIRI